MSAGKHITRIIEDIGSKSQIKSSSIKTLRKKVEETYPNIYGHLDVIWPVKKETIVTQSKIKLYSIKTLLIELRE